MTTKSTGWFRSHKIKAFYTIADGVKFQQGATSFLQASGLGKLRPNILMMGYKRDWAICPRENLNMYFNVMHKALDMHIAVAIVRLDEEQLEDDGGPLGLGDTSEARGGEAKSSVVSIIRGNQSFSQLSQASSISDVSMPATPALGGRSHQTINEYPDAPASPEDSRDPLSREMPPSCGSGLGGETVMRFERKRKKGTIDVWWLYDDGGLTLLLPYIISTRRNWANTKLRVFALANKYSELEYEQRNMASLLSKFRIDYSALKVIADVSKPAQQSTRDFFDSLIADFRDNSEAPTCEDDTRITDSELLAMNEKTNRHLRLRELLQEHSMNANLIVMTLPMPRKGAVSAPLYMAWLETLTRDTPPFLLVRGNHTSVLTFYS